MEHKRLSHILLFAGGIALLGVAAVFLIGLPLLLLRLRQAIPLSAPLLTPLLLLGFAVAALYIAALWYYACISRRIGRNESFCVQNAQALSRISRFLYAAAALCLLATLAMGIFLREGKRFCVIPLLLCLASLALGLLSGVIARLVQRAALLQEENDLTI